MRVAVLGGGLLGCCVALMLARRGARVALFDRHDALLRGAASNNEGKIHLGYVYAGDGSTATARRMIAGALAFRPIMERLLESRDVFNLSTPFSYLVHHSSQKTVQEFNRYLAAVHEELVRASQDARADYFGIDLFRPRAYTRRELESAFDTATVAAAFYTPEIAINPLQICEALRARIAAEPNIELRLRRTVVAAKEQGSKFCLLTEPGLDAENYDQVVNALWDGRLAVDAECGLHPPRPWLYRLKYGVRFRAPAITRSVTIVLGPFGDAVAYGDGSQYLSWYPVGMRAVSSDLALPVQAGLSAEDRRTIIEGSFRGLGEIMPDVRVANATNFASAEVCGGIIVAWGRSDIDDPASELHCRYDIGVSSLGGYHSVDPGKFTMAPYFAKICADRVMSGQGHV
jgi:FAD dependent oxidoreductase